MKTLIVTNKYNGKKLCNFILTSFPNLSQNTLYKALRQKDIKINGKRVNKDCIIFENDELVIKKIKLPKNLSKNIDLYRKMLSIPEHVDEQMVIADQRYKYIYALCKSAIKRKHPPEYITLTDRIDKIVTNFWQYQYLL